MIMIEISISPAQIEEGRRFLHRNKATFAPDSGIRMPDGQRFSSAELGKLGEILVRDRYAGASEEIESYEADLLIYGRRVEIKTKKCTSRPRADYLCSTALSSSFQQPAFFCFVRILMDLSTGWILGFIERTEFLCRSELRRAGEIDVNGFIFKADCYNIPASELSFQLFPPPTDQEQGRFLAAIFSRRGE